MRTAGDRKIAPYTPDTWTEEEKKDKFSSCRSKDHGGEAGGACGDLPYFLRAGTAG